MSRRALELDPDALLAAMAGEDRLTTQATEIATLAHAALSSEGEMRGFYSELFEDLHEVVRKHRAGTKPAGAQTVDWKAARAWAEQFVGIEWATVQERLPRELSGLAEVLGEPRFRALGEAIEAAPSHELWSALRQTLATDRGDAWKACRLAAHVLSFTRRQSVEVLYRQIAGARKG